MYMCLSVCVFEALKTFRSSSLLLSNYLDVAAYFADGAVITGELPPPGGSSYYYLCY